VPGSRSRFRNGLEFAAFRFVLATLAVPPLAIAYRLGSFYSKALDRLIPRLRRVALSNLESALPELSPSARDALADGAFASIGRILVSFARFPRIDRNNVNAWIRCEGIEHVDAALANGRGLLFATGHLGNWELSAFAFALMHRPIRMVVRPLDNPLIDALVTRYRGLSGNQSIDKREYARGILQSLARNEMVGILADQHVQDGALIDFFGQPAATSTGLAKLAARTGAQVIPGFALWSPAEKKYVLRFYPPVEITGDALADTQRVQAAIEAAIRQYPDQWLWMHRRWKV
jgi:KDO2-lipid IV(A) lauroyltransferase